MTLIKIHSSSFMSEEGLLFLCVVSTVIKLESDNEVLLLLASLFIQKSSKTHIMIVVFGG